MTASERNELIISLIEASQDLRWEDRLLFHATLANMDDRRLLAEVNQVCPLTIYVDGKSLPFPCDLTKIEAGTLEYSLQLPNPTHEYALVKDFPSLLSVPKFYATAPKRYYSVVDRTVEIPKAYLDAVEFGTLLTQIADHTDRSSDMIRCFFYQGVKVGIAIQYTQEDLRELVGIDALVEGFASNPHLQERAKILKELIVRHSVGATEEKVFSVLLSRFTRMKQDFDQNWALFLNNFSLDKILSELEVKTLSLADKLAGSLGELQKTMITIPLAILFISSQISQGGLGSWKNLLILGGVWVFYLFTLAFFWGHKQSATFIEEELSTLKKQVEKECPQIQKRVDEKIDVLQRMCQYQKSYRCVISVLMTLVVIGLTLTVCTTR